MTTSPSTTATATATSTVSSLSLRPVVICGPSGVGKGTLIEKLFQTYPSAVGFSVSHTTRQPRPGEQHGIHYHYTTVPEIQQEIEEGKFLEYAEVHGKYYGTSIAAVESVQQQGKVCILDIDVQGVQKIKANKGLTLQPLYLFIAPPSIEELERRLRGRNTETEDAIVTRLSNAATELQYGQTPGNFDQVLINDNLDHCFETLTSTMETWYPHLKDHRVAASNDNKK